MADETSSVVSFAVSKFPVVSSRKLKNSVLNGRRMGSRAPRDRSSATHRYYHHRSITIECIMSSVFFSLLRISHRFTRRRPTDGSISLVVYRHPAAAAAHFAYTYSNIVGCRAEICWRVCARVLLASKVGGLQQPAPLLLLLLVVVHRIVFNVFWRGIHNLSLRKTCCVCERWRKEKNIYIKKWGRNSEVAGETRHMCRPGVSGEKRSCSSSEGTERERARQSGEKETGKQISPRRREREDENQLPSTAPRLCPPPSCATAIFLAV